MNLQGIFDTNQLLIVHHRLYLPELRCIHHLCLQMLLDDFCQIPSPCLLVLFGNEWWTLLTVEGVPGKWFEVKMPEEGFVLWVVWFHKFIFFSIRYDRLYCSTSLPHFPLYWAEQLVCLYVSCFLDAFYCH